MMQRDTIHHGLPAGLPDPDSLAAFLEGDWSFTCLARTRAVDSALLLVASVL